MNQLLRLVDTVYRAEINSYDEKGNIVPDLEERWRKIVKDFAKLEVRWDPAKNMYTFKDGSILPPRVPKKFYRREIWKLRTPRDVKWVTMERKDNLLVRIESKLWGIGGHKPDPVTIRVYAAKDRRKPLAELTNADLHPRADEEFSGSESLVVELAEGESIVLESVSGNESKVSPVFKP